MQWSHFRGWCGSFPRRQTALIFCQEGLQWQVLPSLEFLFLPPSRAGEGHFRKWKDQSLSILGRHGKSSKVCVPTGFRTQSLSVGNHQAGSLGMSWHYGDACSSGWVQVLKIYPHFTHPRFQEMAQAASIPCTKATSIPQDMVMGDKQVRPCTHSQSKGSESTACVMAPKFSTQLISVSLFLLKALLT